MTDASDGGGGDSDSGSGSDSDELYDGDCRVAAPSWERIECSRNYPDTLLPPDDQFRNVFTTHRERVDNALALFELDTPHDLFNGPPVGTLVYHGGAPLQRRRGATRGGVFYVSMARSDALRYAGGVEEDVHVYRIVKPFECYSILWDELAASYGFDVDLARYTTWKQFDEDFDMGEFGDAQRAAEYAAHALLREYSERERLPLVVCSWQDSEFGFFPTAYDCLKFIR